MFAKNNKNFGGGGSGATVNRVKSAYTIKRVNSNTKLVNISEIEANLTEVQKKIKTLSHSNQRCRSASHKEEDDKLSVFSPQKTSCSFNDSVIFQQHDFKSSEMSTYLDSSNISISRRIQKKYTLTNNIIEVQDDCENAEKIESALASKKKERKRAELNLGNYKKSRKLIQNNPIGKIKKNQGEIKNSDRCVNKNDNKHNQKDNIRSNNDKGTIINNSDIKPPAKKYPSITSIPPNHRKLQEQHQHQTEKVQLKKKLQICQGEIIQFLKNDKLKELRLAQIFKQIVRIINEN